MLFRFYLLFATLVVPLQSVAQDTFVKSMMTKTTTVKSTATLPNKKLTTCMDHYPPYQYVTGIPTGIHVNSMKKLAALFNRKLIIIKSPNFARCLALLKTGKVDVIAGAIKNKQREEYAFFAPYRKIDKLILVSKKSSVKSFDDFYNKIIGIPRGTNYYTQFDNDKRITKIDIPTVNAGIQLVLKERIDGVLTSNLVVDTLISAEDSDKFMITEVARVGHKETYSYFAFSRKNKLGIPQPDVIAITTAAFSHDVFKSP